MQQSYMRISKSLFAITVLTAAFPAASFATVNPCVPGIEQNVAVQYTGEELFRSIVFIDGPASSLFPVIKNNLNLDTYLKTAQDKAEYKYLEDNAVDYVKRTNPTFLAKFQADMYSKDPVKIKASITSAFQLLTPYIDSNLKSKGSTYNITALTDADKAEINKNYDAYLKNSSSGYVVDFVIQNGYALYLYVMAAVYVFQGGAGISQTMYMDELSSSISTNLK